MKKLSVLFLMALMAITVGLGGFGKVALAKDGGLGDNQGRGGLDLEINDLNDDNGVDLNKINDINDINNIVGVDLNDVNDDNGVDGINQ